MNKRCIKIDQKINKIKNLIAKKKKWQKTNQVKRSLEKTVTNKP